MQNLPGVDSQWFPYFNTQTNYFDLSDSVEIPKKICDYLLDMPNPKLKYAPKDDNKNARVRLWKYLYYDAPLPLSKPLPTPKEKQAVLFNPFFPDTPPDNKGYRLFPQVYVKQAQEAAQTRLMVYMGRSVPAKDELSINLSVVFSIWTNYAYELNTKSDAYSRAFAIEQALIEAFHGVNMGGIGTFYFSKLKHPDCGSRAIFDGNTNVGRELTMALEIMTAATPKQENLDNLPLFSENSNLKIG